MFYLDLGSPTSKVETWRTSRLHGFEFWVCGGTLGHSFAPASWCWSDWQKTLGQSCSKQLALCIWNMRVITYPVTGINNYTYLSKYRSYFACAQSHVLCFDHHLYAVSSDNFARWITDCKHEMELLQYGFICQLAPCLAVDHLLGPGEQGSCFMDPISANSENMQVYSCSFDELQWFQWVEFRW